MAKTGRASTNEHQKCIDGSISSGFFLNIYILVVKMHVNAPFMALDIATSVLELMPNKQKDCKYVGLAFIIMLVN